MKGNDSEFHAGNNVEMKAYKSSRIEERESLQTNFYPIMARIWIQAIAVGILILMIGLIISYGTVYRRSSSTDEESVTAPKTD